MERQAFIGNVSKKNYLAKFQFTFDKKSFLYFIITSIIKHCGTIGSKKIISSSRYPCEMNTFWKKALNQSGND